MNNDTLKTVEGTVLPMLEEVLLGNVKKYVNAMVITDQKRFPNYTLTQLATEVDGDLKHAVRVHLGFMGFEVDLGWENADYQAQLLPLIDECITENFPTLA